MRILFLGAPGTGKSTQGQLLAEKLGWRWLSSGAVLRGLGKEEVDQKLKTGELFDDQQVAKLVLPEIERESDLILDGFPRTRSQVELLKKSGKQLDLVIEIMVPEAELVKRILSRGRAEDNAAVIERRLEIYRKTRDKMVEALEEQGVQIETVDGEGSIEAIEQKIEELMNRVLGNGKIAQ